MKNMPGTKVAHAAITPAYHSSSSNHDVTRAPMAAGIDSSSEPPASDLAGGSDERLERDDEPRDRCAAGSFDPPDRLRLPALPSFVQVVIASSRPSAAVRNAASHCHGCASLYVLVCDAR